MLLSLLPGRLWAVGRRRRVWSRCCSLGAVCAGQGCARRARGKGTGAEHGHCGRRHPGGVTEGQGLGVKKLSQAAGPWAARKGQVGPWSVAGREVAGRWAGVFPARTERGVGDSIRDSRQPKALGAPADGQAGGGGTSGACQAGWRPWWTWAVGPGLFRWASRDRVVVQVCGFRKTV